MHLQTAVEVAPADALPRFVLASNQFGAAALESLSAAYRLSPTDTLAHVDLLAAEPAVREAHPWVQQLLSGSMRHWAEGSALLVDPRVRGPAAACRRFGWPRLSLSWAFVVSRIDSSGFSHAGRRRAPRRASTHLPVPQPPKVPQPPRIELSGAFHPGFGPLPCA